MHSVQILKASVLAFAAAIFVSEVAAGTPAPVHGRAPARHRRHHAKKSNYRRASNSNSCGSPSSSGSSSSGHSSGSSQQGGNDGSSSSSSSDTTTATNSTSNSGHSSSSGSSSGLGLNSGLLKIGGLDFGFLPDDGSGGGTSERMAQINQAIGTKASTYGWYSQVHSGQTYTGGQLLEVMQDVKASGAVFQPAVMPVGGWQGLKHGDDSQAVNIANVLKKFTDQGIPVWLRFAHEMNYYQTDGTYQGNAADFKEGWAVVAAAVKKICPEVKMWWTPNIASADSYAQYAPDMSTVDLVGIDYYPKNLQKGDFVAKMKPFHDKYAVNGVKFAIGETGLGYAGSDSDRLAWLNQMVDAQSSMPELVAATWFNYQKGYEFKLVGNSNLDSQFKALIKS